MANTASSDSTADNYRYLRLLTYLMFFTFAMTTDAVGKIIPEIIEEFELTLTQAGTFHYATMIAIAVSGIGLGFLSDKYGRKAAILGGLGLFGIASFLFLAKLGFSYFVVLLVFSGIAIGVFRTGALALIGDISNNSKEHTRTMTMAEAWFAVGAIVGPAIATALINSGLSWTYLYVFAGVLAAGLCAIAAKAKYPEIKRVKKQPTDLKQTLRTLKNPYTLGFGSLIALYVVVEAGVYVWMPTLLKGYDGSLTAFVAWTLPVFFVFRAVGRFVGAWLVSVLDWRILLVVTTGLVLLCFVGAEVLGINAAAWLLPLSGLFMSVIYPTLNSKGISCFHASQHGSIAGIILFFTAAAAALGPLTMAAFGDLLGSIKFGFTFATICAGILFAGCLYLWLVNPVEKRLRDIQAQQAAE
jgi:fucose permease